MKPGNLIKGKYNFNRCGTVIDFVFNFLAELAGINEIYNDLIKFNNETNELKKRLIL